MNERQPVPPFGDTAMTPMVGGSPPRGQGAERAASLDRKARTDSVARLLYAFADYERTVALLRTAVLGLCLPGRDRDADGLLPNRTEEGNRPHG